MKKLFAALASAALVGTVFAQTGVPASATQPQAGATKDQVKVVKEKSATHAKADKDKTSVSAQGDEAKVQASANKENANVKADASKSAAKGTHHKASKTKAVHTEAGMAKSEAKNDSDKVKAKADMAKPEAQPEAAKAAASVDKTKKQ
ncbi:hypothetical protein BJN34_34585 [Cupriavidus necator]|uniref:Uncharacterized protein n=1 Tax=Cupriavidus necator TaxID=106590 RepID=A0A1U9V2H5_CUPNE|nr:hypothetical protein [Cupriavidus necator]AQV99009.1 hypothetical protein BJN34_34585 [Cupriavidus necator]